MLGEIAKEKRRKFAEDLIKQERKNNTFQPKIDPKSRKMNKSRTVAALRDLQQDENVCEDMNLPTDRFTDLYNEAAIRQLKTSE